MIGETQSYNNNFGNLEVTLDYVEFLNRIENPILGGYFFPDEGSIFLHAVLTLRNIGTEQADLLTSWNRIVYDERFEFGQIYQSDGLHGINPLTPPRSGAITFMVANSVARDDRSLVLNFGDGSGRNVMSFVIRPGLGSTAGTTTTRQSIPLQNPTDAAIVSELIGRWRVGNAHGFEWFEGGEILEFLPNGRGVETYGSERFNFRWFAGFEEMIDYNADIPYEVDILILRLTYDDFELLYRLVYDYDDSSIIWDGIYMLLDQGAGPPLELEKL